MPPKHFSPDHARVELLVPRAVQGVGDVEPLAIQAELHLAGAAVHPLALQTQRTAPRLPAAQEVGAGQSRAAPSPPLLAQRAARPQGHAAPQRGPCPDTLCPESAAQSRRPEDARGQRGHRTHLDHQGLRLALQLFIPAHGHGPASGEEASHKDLRARQRDTRCRVIHPPQLLLRNPQRNPAAPASPVPPAWACRFWRARTGGCLRATSC